MTNRGKGSLSQARGLVKLKLGVQTEQSVFRGQARQGEAMEVSLVMLDAHATRLRARRASHGAHP